MSIHAEFEAWAPEHIVWSRWAKPTMFVDQGTPLAAIPKLLPMTSEGLGWPEAIPPRSCVVLELPGPMSVEAGLALRDRGYWPVPLFNATHANGAIVHVEPIALALRAAARSLSTHQTQPGDPPPLPCFLLDAGRCPPVSPSPGRYDNRSIVFPQDFPSATMLRSHSIEQAVVVTHDARDTFAPDLRHVLHGWQRDGLRIMRFSLEFHESPQPVQVDRPSGFGMFWQRIVAASGFRRNAAGGFGSLVPMPSESSGHYG